MQQSRLLPVLFALVAFSMVAFAAPTAGKEVVARTLGPLDVILNLFLDLKVKLDVCIAGLVKLDVNADISAIVVGQIVVLIKACITALVSVGAVVDLSDKDKITAIATVCAQIIVSLNACVSVFANILVNVTAVVSLDVALQGLLIQLNLCVSGILTVIAPLCVDLTATVNLALTLVIALLGL